MTDTCDGVILRRSDRPLLDADRPWEDGAILRAISVMPDDSGGRLRLYYVVWDREDFSRNALCVAYSRDGFDWEKPDLGEGHNVVMRGSASGNWRRVGPVDGHARRYRVCALAHGYHCSRKATTL